MTIIQNNRSNYCMRISLKFFKIFYSHFMCLWLSKNFIFKKNRSRFLVYDDIYMKDLYQVEMLTNYLSDKNIIIHESISTGAETGLFLSEEQMMSFIWQIQ